MNGNDNADPAMAGRLAQQIVDLLLGQDSATRQRAIQAAMLLLGESMTQKNGTRSNSTSNEYSGDEEGDLATFFDREGDLKPADYTNLCAAYIYSLYGAAAFSIEELKQVATDAGVVIPDRADMTIRNALQKGKKLFQPAGTGMFKPTAAGCLAMKERWQVKPGRKVKTIASKGANGAEVG